MCVTCVCIVEEYSRGLKGGVDGGWGGGGGRFERGGGSQGRARLDVGRGWGVLNWEIVSSRSCVCTRYAMLCVRFVLVLAMLVYPLV